MSKELSQHENKSNETDKLHKELEKERQENYENLKGMEYLILNAREELGQNFADAEYWRRIDLAILKRLVLGILKIKRITI